MDYSESSKNAVNDMHYTLGEAYIQDSWKIKPRLTLDYGLRFSYFGPWTDNSGIGMAAFNRANYGSGTGSYPGIAWTAIDPNTPLSGVDGSWFYVTPRVGFAWDLKGSGETVVRGGVGMYRYHEPQSIYSGLLAVGQGSQVVQRRRNHPQGGRGPRRRCAARRAGTRSSSTTTRCRCPTPGASR